MRYVIEYIRIVSQKTRVDTGDVRIGKVDLHRSLIGAVNELSAHVMHQIEGNRAVFDTLVGKSWHVAMLETPKLCVTQTGYLIEFFAYTSLGIAVRATCARGGT